MAVAPIFYLTISYFMATLFLVAATHKLVRGHHFRKSMAGYGVVPEGWLHPAGMALAMAEIVIGLALLFGAAGRGAGGVAGIAAAILFISYGGLMGLALLRGRGAYGCGCEWGEVAQPIRKWMVVRNGLFAVLAILLAFASMPNAPTVFDIGNAAAAALALFMINSSVAAIFAVSYRIKLI